MGNEMPTLPKQAEKELRRIADLVEVHGGNMHRAKAFANAARAVRRIEGDLEALVRSGEILKVRGIGKGTAAVLEDLVAGERSTALVELEEMTPRGLLEVLEVPGLGPKKVRTLWQELGVVSLGELAYACRENRLVELKGFGAASQASVHESVGFLMRSRRRHHLHRAHAVATELRRCLEEGLAPCMSRPRVELTGELRRGAATVGRVELLISGAADDGAALGRVAREDPGRALVIMRDHVEGLEPVVIASMQGFDELCAAVPGVRPGTSLRSFEGAFDGLVCRVHIAGPGCRGIALIATTGSDAHAERFLGQARSSGLPERLAGADAPGWDGAAPLECEQRLYEAIGCQWVPPELRERAADLDRAARHELPDLIRLEDLQGALHNHTRDSDGAASVEEMAETAERIGWSFLGVADHSPAAFYANGVDSDRLRAQWQRIDAWNRGHPRLRVLKGLEADILTDGALDIPPGCEDGLDYVVASVHTSFKLPRDRQTERIIRAVRHPRCSVLGHPTGRLRLARPSYELDLDAVIAECAANEVVVEINASPYRLDLGVEAARRALALGVRVAINPDAHEPGGLEDVRWGVLVARRAGATRDDVINCSTNAGLPLTAR